ELAEAGAMASVPRPAEEVAARLAGGLDGARDGGHGGLAGGPVGIAAVNGPSATVVSGTAAAVDALVAGYVAEGVRARRVAVDYASHSPHVEPVRDRLLADLAGIRPGEGDVPFCSTVTGGLLDGGELTPAYWYRNLREPVRFDAAVATMLAAGRRVFVEVSPHPVLMPAIAERVEEAGGGAVTPTLRRDEGGFERFYASLAEVFAAGGTVDWPGALAAAGLRGRHVDLPTYAFQRQRYWLGDGALEYAPARPPAGPAEDLPGATLPARLEGLGEDDALRLLTSEVRAQAAAVLGHPGPEAVDPARPFTQIGLDSMGAVKLRDRLNAAAGVRLATTVIFDHPTAEALAGVLRAEIAAAGAVPVEEPLDLQLDRLQATLLRTAALDREGVGARLRTMLAALGDEDPETPADGLADRLGGASDDEMFAFIDGQLDGV
ncbi:MAG: acyltransferase domain-containing protein, partial [Actinoallomurus sp.]